MSDILSVAWNLCEALMSDILSYLFQVLQARSMTMTSLGYQWLGACVSTASDRSIDVCTALNTSFGAYPFQRVIL